MKKDIDTSVCHPHIRQMNAVGADELKKAVYAYCCNVEEEDIQKYDENAIFPELLPVWQAFKKNDFDFYKFMLEKDYELIEDEDMRVEVLMCTCFLLLNLPIGRFAIDWLNGYLDFFERSNSLKCSDIGWLGDNVITDTDILYHLYFCSTEEEIWKIMACGIGDIESLYKWYSGRVPCPILKAATGLPCYYEKDETKAKAFLDYLLSSTTESVRNKATYLKKSIDNNSL